MNIVERKYEYTIKQYQRRGFGINYYFVDAYCGKRLEKSIIMYTPLSDSELERFFNVFLSRLNQGKDVDFVDSTERKMNELISNNKPMLSALEHTLSQKMGKTHFDTHYEKCCYYLLWRPQGYDSDVWETFHISKDCSPLMCIKMAYQMGESLKENYRIVLSDKVTVVDPELLAFAISEI